MTSISFPSLTSILESLRLKSSPAEPLRKDLESFDMGVIAQSQSDTPLHKAVAYLSEHSNSKLEQAVKDKFAEATPEIRKTALNTFGAVLDDSNHARMLKICKKIMDLKLLKDTFEVEKGVELAELESHYTPKPAHFIEVISNPIRRYWTQYSHFLGKILNFIVIVPLGTLSGIIFGVSELLRKPPTDTMHMKGYIYSYEIAYAGYRKIAEYFIEYFGSKQKAFTAAVKIAFFLFVLNYVKNWYHLGRAEDLGKRGSVENLNLKVKEGLIEPTEARKEEKRLLETCWAESVTKNFRIAMLVGPTGCGKTQLMEGIAWDCEKNPASPFYGKFVHRINTSQLVIQNQNRNNKVDLLDRILERIKGHEDDFIIFFDEAHNAGAEAGQIGYVLQIFKTKLPSNVRICLATTKIEFDAYIKPDVAFVDRIKEIIFEPLSDRDTRAVLTNTVKLENDSPIEVDESAYDAILQVAATDPDYMEKVNPRKSLQLLQELTNTIFQWTPTLLEKELETALREEKKASEEIRQASNKNANWSSSTEGKTAIVDLKGKREAIKTLKNKQLVQQQHRQKITGLQKLQALYRKQKNEAIHFLTMNPNHQEAEKNFLLLKFVLLPQVQKALQNAAASFEKEYKENVPLILNAEWIKSRFPKSFPSSSELC